MVLTQEELIKRVTDLIGDTASDEAIALLEDVTDTTNYYISKDSEDWDAKFAAKEAEWAAKYAALNDEWQGKYDELDSAWRQRYIGRFNGEVKDDDIIEEPEDIEDPVIDDKPKTYEELFEVR